MRGDISAEKHCFSFVLIREKLTAGPSKENEWLGLRNPELPTKCCLKNFYNWKNSQEFLAHWCLPKHYLERKIVGKKFEGSYLMVKAIKI